MTLPPRPDVLLLSTAEWNNPFWTNKQHVAVELARAGHRVLYVDSLGLRKPTATKRDIGRILRRLAKAFKAPVCVRDNIWTVAPVLLPGHWGALARAVNKLCFKLMFKSWATGLGFTGPRWLWTYSPLTMDYVDPRGFARSIYHCVDEIKAQPGMPVARIERSERRLCAAVDVIFATSPELADSRRTLNPETFYLPNVADFDHFNQATRDEVEVPDDLAVLPGPRIGFIGAVSSYKLDFDLLKAIAGAHPEWSIVIIGEVGEGDPHTDASSLARHRNIHLLGPRDYKDLPRYLKGIDVAILPNRLNDYTRAMFPMKFFEYLAAGKPVVSVELPALKAYSAQASMSRDADEFIGNIERALAGDAAPLEERLALARQHTYAARSKRMFELIQKPA